MYSACGSPARLREQHSRSQADPPACPPAADRAPCAGFPPRSMLGLGTNIPNAEGLPKMDAEGKIPKDLGEKYGQMILDADGFAQVYPGARWEGGPGRWQAGGSSSSSSAVWAMRQESQCGPCLGCAAAPPALSPPAQPPPTLWPLPFSPCRAQVPDCGGAAPAGLCRGHDGRRCERCPRAQARRRRYRRVR